jgi:hypothetical protein
MHINDTGAAFEQFFEYGETSELIGFAGQDGGERELASVAA